MMNFNSIQCVAQLYGIKYLRQALKASKTDNYEIIVLTF